MRKKNTKAKIIPRSEERKKKNTTSMQSAVAGYLSGEEAKGMRMLLHTTAFRGEKDLYPGFSAEAEAVHAMLRYARPSPEKPRTGNRAAYFTGTEHPTKKIMRKYTGASEKSAISAESGEILFFIKDDIKDNY